MHWNFGVRPSEDLSSNLQGMTSVIPKASGPVGFRLKSAAGIGVAGGSQTLARRTASARIRSTIRGREGELVLRRLGGVVARGEGVTAAIPPAGGSGQEPQEGTDPPLHARLPEGIGSNARFPNKHSAWCHLREVIPRVP